MQVGGHEARLPIVNVYDVGCEALDRAAADVRCGARECGEAERVIGPVEAVRARVNISGSRIEMRCVENEKLQAGRGARDDARFAPKKFGSVKTAEGASSDFKTAV